MEYQLNTLLIDAGKGQVFCVALPFYNPFEPNDAAEAAFCRYRTADIFRSRLDEAAIEQDKANEIKEAVTQALNHPNQTFSVDGVELSQDQIRKLGFARFASRV